MNSDPPPGIDLNADMKADVISPVIALMVIASVSVALRVASKYYTSSGLQLDDYLILTALVVGYGTGCLTILACSKGIGKHIWNPTVQLGAVIKLLWIYEFFYTFTVLLIKLSILSFYHRLFPVQAFKKILYIVIFLVASWWVAGFIIPFFQCRPYNYFWNQYIDPTAKGKCVNILALYLSYSTVGVVTDFLILFIPIPMVWSLQMPIAKRLGILSILALGGFACIAGVIRLALIARMFKSADLTWNMSQSFVWSSVEPNIGIACACLPMLYPLVRRYLPSWFPGSTVGVSSQPVYGTGPSRLRTQNGDFYALSDRGKDPRKDNKSEDEIGLTNEIHGGRCPNTSTEDGIGSKDQMHIVVKRDIVME